MHSYVCIVSPHLIMLDAPREGCDVGAEPKDGLWWTYPEARRTKQVLGPEMSPGRCELTEVTCVRSQASPRVL